MRYMGRIFLMFCRFLRFFCVVCFVRRVLYYIINTLRIMLLAFLSEINMTACAKIVFLFTINVYIFYSSLYVLYFPVRQLMVK